MTGIDLKRILKIDAKHALYREDGKWYHHLKEFPGILFDINGYLLFRSENDYFNNLELQHGIDLHIKNGISSLAGYKPFNTLEKKNILVSGQVDLNEESIRVLRQSTIIKRNIKFVNDIKMKYNNTCQICGTSLKIRENLFYSEVHHIKPLGSPYNGPDKLYNMICVCPNHHVLLDLGAIPLSMNDLFSLKHSINEEFLNFYMEMIFDKK